MRAAVALFILFFLGTTTVPALAAEQPTFRQFLVPVYTGPAAPLQWNENLAPSEVVFSYTSYKEMTTQQWRHFAGYYLVVSLNCGIGVQCGVLVDRRSGKIAGLLPMAVSDYDYHADSRLLIVNPYNHEDPPAIEYVAAEDRYTHYMVWDGREFSRIAVEPWPIP